MSYRVILVVVVQRFVCIWCNTNTYISRNECDINIWVIQGIWVDNPESLKMFVYKIV